MSLVLAFAALPVESPRQRARCVRTGRFVAVSRDVLVSLPRPVRVDVAQVVEVIAEPTTAAPQVAVVSAVAPAAAAQAAASPASVVVDVVAGAAVQVVQAVASAVRRVAVLAAGFALAAGRFVLAAGRPGRQATSPSPEQEVTT